MSENIETFPLGYMASKEDWNEAFAGRSMAMSDWYQLTLGEQADYATREIKSQGASFASKVSGNQITFTMDLPESVCTPGLSAENIDHLTSYLRRQMEKQVTAILQIRQISGK